MQDKVPFLVVLRKNNPFKTRCTRAFKSALALYGYDYEVISESFSTKLQAFVYPEDAPELYQLYFTFGGV